MIMSPSAIGSSVPLCQTFCLGKILLHAATTSKLVIQLGLCTARNIHIWTKIKGGLSIHKFNLLTILSSHETFIWFSLSKNYICHIFYSLSPLYEKNNSFVMNILVCSDLGMMWNTTDHNWSSSDFWRRNCRIIWYRFIRRFMNRVVWTNSDFWTRE